MEKVCYFVFMFKCQTPGVLFQCDLYVREIILRALLERLHDLSKFMDRLKKTICDKIFLVQKKKHVLSVCMWSCVFLYE